MNVMERTQHRINHVRCPVIQGLDRDTVHMLHQSLVEIVHMRRSIERAELQIGRSLAAATDTMQLLGQLLRKRF